MDRSSPATTATITEGWRALELFTDRYDLVRSFCECLNEPASLSRILFLYGDGGNGKSLLLRFLREKCTKRLHSHHWTRIKELEAAHFLSAYLRAPVREATAICSLDFGMKPHGEDRPQEAFSALVMLRNALGAQHVRLPLFDCVCALYLHKTHHPLAHHLDRLFSPEALDFIEAVLGLIDGPTLGLGKAIMRLFGESLGRSFRLYLRRRGLNPELIEIIHRMDPRSELLDSLPRFFAEDLNAAIGSGQAPKRLVLFFDSHEAFWGPERQTSRALFFSRDEWLRCLLSSLDLSRVTVVMAGREQPPWSEAARFNVSVDDVDCRRVDCLSGSDALEFLERAGVEDPAVREALVGYTAVVPGRVHPLFLGIAADVVLAALDLGVTFKPEDIPSLPNHERRRVELLERLLRYSDLETEAAVTALSACRAFNRAVYRVLGSATSSREHELGFQATEATFLNLTRFSFILPADRFGSHWFRVHDLVRRLIAERSPEEVRRAHEVLESYYRERGERGEIADIVETLYHANRLDWKVSVVEWLALFIPAVRRTDGDLCRALLDLRGDLVVAGPVEEGEMARATASFFALFRRGEALQEYEHAIDCFRRARDSNGDVEDLVRLATALEGRARYLFRQSEHAKALPGFDESLEVFDEALSRSPGSSQAHTLRANALQGLGDLHLRLSHHDQAGRLYIQATMACDEANRITPNYKAFNYKGNALKGLGDLYARTRRQAEAEEQYQKSVESYESAHELAPDIEGITLNQVHAMRALADLYLDLGRTKRALQIVALALVKAEQGLETAPDDCEGFCIRGDLRETRARTLDALGMHLEAEREWHLALGDYNEALNRAPGFLRAQRSQAVAMVNLACHLSSSGDWPKAIDYCKEADARCREIVDSAPEYVGAYTTHGVVLTTLGQLRAKEGDEAEARRTLEAAVASFDQALALASGDLMATMAKETAEEKLASLSLTGSRGLGERGI